MHQSNTRSKVQAAAALFVITAIIVIGSIATRTKPMASVADTTQATSTTKTAICKTAVTADTTLKDGNYQAIGSYSSPGGTEKIAVSLTIASNTVTDATVTSKANDPTAAAYQEYFISGYKQLVVGKKISEIKLSNVSGSSLTSKGFNQALQSIACQAEQA